MITTLAGTTAAGMVLCIAGLGFAVFAVAGQVSGSAPFEARTATLTGTIVLHAPIDQVFPLFSPLGEIKWVEGWHPEILSPRGAEWVQGMVFRTPADAGDAIWIVAELDLRAHHVVYFRTEPGRLVARVEVNCRALDPQRTETTVGYSYVGLADAGNAEIAEWTDAAYRSKMERWQTIINDYLHRPAR